MITSILISGSTIFACCAALLESGVIEDGTTDNEPCDNGDSECLGDFSYHYAGTDKKSRGHNATRTPGVYTGTGSKSAENH